MSDMISSIHSYMKKPDAIGFWVECDGNEMTAKRLNKWQWEVEVEYWTGVSDVRKLSVDQTIHQLEALTLYDDHAVYSLFEPVTKWSACQVDKFMAGLAPTMCKPNYKGFTLSADGAKTFVVEKFPYDFVMWRINGKPADFIDVLHATRAKLAENVFWKHTEL